MKEGWVWDTGSGLPEAILEARGGKVMGFTLQMKLGPSVKTH